MPGSFTIPTIFTAIDRFSGPMTAMRGAIGSFVVSAEAGMARAERAFRRVMAPLIGINKLLAGMGYYVGLFTILLVLRNAVNVMADFQQANVDLALVMETTVQKNRVLADQARRVGLAFGQAATEVSKLQYELATLGFKQADILSITPAIVTGAVALRTSPEELAKTVGAVIQSFKQFGPQDAQRIVDLMTKVANETALTFADLQTMLPTVSKPADLVNITFEDLIAHLGVLRNAQVHVATSGTSMKNMIIDTNVHAQKLDAALEKISQKSRPLAAAFKKFDKRSAVSASVLASELEQVAELRAKLEKTKVGLALEIATDRLKTFRGASTLARAAYDEFILSIDDGTGAWSAWLTKTAQVFSAMFLISSGTSQAQEALQKLDPSIITSANRWLFLVKVVMFLAAAIITARIAMMVWSVVIFLAKVALFAFNVVLGLTSGLFGFHWVAVGRSTVALVAYRVGVVTATAATWLFNAALAANPIVWMGAIVAGFIALIAAMVVHWNEWGAAVSILLGPLGLVISLIQSFRRNWDNIVNAFSSGGIIAGIKAIGLAIFDALLQPLQQMYELIAKITGAKWASDLSTAIKAVRAHLQAGTVDPNVTLPGGIPQPGGGPAVNPNDDANRVAREKSSADKPSSFGKIILEADMPWWMRAKSDSDSLKVIPSLNSTMSY